MVGGGGTLLAGIAGAKAGALVGALAGPAGAGVGAAVGAVVGGVGSLLITPLRKKVQSLFTSKAKIMEENRELLRTGIGKILTELEDQVMAEVSRTIAGVREALATAYARRAKAEADALTVADLLACQQQVVHSTISTLDQETACCLLRADARPRLAASVGKVTRLPGVCIAIEVPDEALAEAWLFPPSSPEIITFARAPSPNLPGARATSYVLGLTEEVPASLQCRPERTIVTTNAPAPNLILEAWSATLSDHLGTQVEIARPSAPRSMTA